MVSKKTRLESPSAMSSVLSQVRKHLIRSVNSLLPSAPEALERFSSMRGIRRKSPQLAADLVPRHSWSAIMYALPNEPLNQRGGSRTVRAECRSSSAKLACSKAGHALRGGSLLTWLSASLRLVCVRSPVVLSAVARSRVLSALVGTATGVATLRPRPLLPLPSFLRLGLGALHCIGRFRPERSWWLRLRRRCL